jgi:hypothetical protein
MTTVAGHHIPDEWNKGDQLHLEVYARFLKIKDTADQNALMHFAQDLIMDSLDDKRQVTVDDAIALGNFLDTCIEIDHIIRKYLGATYITDYLNTLEEDDE